MLRWCEQHAWLHATPTGDRQRRIAGLSADSPARVLPDLGVDAPMIQWLMEAGWVQQVDGGALGLSWEALLAWQFAVRQPLTYWQLMALHRMSRAYAASWSAALDPQCPPPHGDAHTPETMDAKLQSVFGAMSKRGSGGRNGPAIKDPA